MGDGLQPPPNAVAGLLKGGERATLILIVPKGEYGTWVEAQQQI
jgi:hypothetical protein